MFGWWRLAVSFASSRNIPMKPWSSASEGWMTLSATSPRPCPGAPPRYTIAMPPSAICARTSYWPRRVSMLRGCGYEGGRDEVLGSPATSRRSFTTLSASPMTMRVVPCVMTNSGSGL